MAIQKIDLGTEPLGEGGDTYRSANTKINQNFSNQAHAASRLVGTGNGQIPKYTHEGIDGTGVGGNAKTFSVIQDDTSVRSTLDEVLNYGSGFYRINAPNPLFPRYTPYIMNRADGKTGAYFLLNVGLNGIVSIISGYQFESGSEPIKQVLYGTVNTNKGTNGVLSAKSPVTHLYHDRIEHTGNEKELQPIKFVKQGVGDYLLKNTTGLAQEGWYIVIPQDANGNPLIAVEYDDNGGDVNVRTYKRKFDYEQAKVVADQDNPMDIPETRWIDLRFNDDPTLYEDEGLNEPEPEEDPSADEVEEPEEVVEEPSEESE